MTSLTKEAHNEEGPLPTVKARAIAGVSWTVVGYGAQLVARLGSNLINTRLLTPDAFGLLSLVFVFITGLELLSDFGIGPAIIQSRRSDDSRLLDTAFTVQVIRGFGLAVLAVVIAWPAARLYHEPRLTALLCAAGLVTAIRGFTPMRVHTLNRSVMLRGLTIMELLSQGASIVVTVAMAWWLRSAWALLIGALAGDLARVWLSHAMLPGHRHRFLLDQEALQEIVNVGRWVIVSTAVTFIAGNLDRLTMGRILSVSELGIYTIAYQLCFTVLSVGRTVGSRVFWPMLAETLRTAPDLLAQRLRRVRLFWILPSAAGLLVLSVWGEWVIHLLYPLKYNDAGWMLRLLAAGAVVGAVNAATAVVWPALGEFKVITLLQVAQICILFAAMLVGHAFFGVVGLVAGVAVSELVAYPIQAILVARRGLWQPEIDIPVIAGTALLAGAAALAW